MNIKPERLATLVALGALLTNAGAAQLDGGWSAGIGAAWRVLRFRLSETGPTPNGIGEESGVPVFLRVTQRFGSQMGLHLYGGVIVNGELRVENAHGDSGARTTSTPHRCSARPSLRASDSSMRAGVSQICFRVDRKPVTKKGA
jgi:hypothetical protein